MGIFGLKIKKERKENVPEEWKELEKTRQELFDRAVAFAQNKED